MCSESVVCSTRDLLVVRNMQWQAFGNEIIQDLYMDEHL